MFPGGWPGAGLLLLRLAGAVPLLIGGCSEFLGRQHGGPYMGFVTIGVGAALLVGLWTPITGTLLAMIEIWFAVIHAGRAEICLPLAALGASLVMLGPGAWSVDARLFGRKRINIRSRQRHALPRG
jgi:putative oxidoreductase